MTTSPSGSPWILCRLLAETADLLRQTLPAAIAIATQADLPAEQCVILGDRNQLQQVLLNLALNARDAMPEGGQLTIALSTEEADGEGEAQDVGADGIRSGPHPVLCLTVSDTGKGIPAEIRGRIFEPFFTTKARGQSTGLGLAIVHAIAVDHGATIDVSSAPAEGARFRLCFPREEAGVATASTKVQGRLLIASRDPYQAQVVASAVGRIGVETEQVADWAGLLDALQRHREVTPTVLLDAAFTDCHARDCRAAFAATGARPQVLILTERDAPSVGEYEDAGFLVLERPLPLAELVRLVVAGGAAR